MTHEDAGHYAAKHPEGNIDPVIKKKILARAKNGRVSCAAAHLIAKEQQCSPKTVGMNVDLLEMRLNKCQLGLYGYGKQSSKAFEEVNDVETEFEKAIQKFVVDGRISCENAWQVAKKMKLKKMDVAAACEFLGIKVKPCQLGAF
jgi:hypothetical protein